MATQGTSDNGGGMTEAEFDAFYATAFPRLTGQLYAFTGDHGEAQDVVQEAFVRAWDRRRDFLAEGAPEAWIRTVAMRLAVSRWRRARRWLELVRRTPPRNTRRDPIPSARCWSRRCAGFRRPSGWRWFCTICAT